MLMHILGEASPVRLISAWKTPRLLSPDADDGIKGEMLPGVTLLDVTLLEVIYVTRM